jgi:hypothetical protein
MKEYAPLIIIPCVILVIFACTVSNICGFNTGTDNMQKEAVIKGHAEWVADQSGKPQFKWKECK